jgi:hypothetical protein
MKLKLLAASAVLAAGLGASYAFADDGNHGQGENHGSKCQHIHVRGTVVPQVFTVTLDKGSRRLNLAPGATVVVQVGGAGQVVRLNAESCQGTSSLTAKDVELHVRGTTQTATTQTTAATTSGKGKKKGHGHHGHQGDDD